MKAKGVGELGICGVSVRDYPITLDKLLERMPSIG